MSLGAWVRDYLYIPLGGSREGELKRTRNVMLAMLFTGLWHGTGWTFIVWGAVHGMMLAVNHWWRKHGVSLPAVVSWLLTFGSVLLCWTIFRSRSLGEAFTMLDSMLNAQSFTLPFAFWKNRSFLQGLGGSAAPFILSAHQLAKTTRNIFILLAVILFAPNTGQLIERFKPSKLWVVISAVLAIEALVNFSGISDFLYFQF